MDGREKPFSFNEHLIYEPIVPYIHRIVKYLLIYLFNNLLLGLQMGQNLNFKEINTFAEVTLTIYGANGSVVRTLGLGHQAAGIYQNRSRAAYWDGKNEVGESVASGIYFYTLFAGDFRQRARC